MMSGGRPLSPAGVITGTNTRPPRFGESLGPDPYSANATIDVSFFDEQKRRRGQTWRLSLVCFLIALALGVAISTLLGPLALAIAGGMLKLAVWLGCGNLCRDVAHGIGSYARDGLRLLAILVDQHAKAGMPADKLVIVRGLVAAIVVLLPPMVGAALAWLIIRRSLARAGMPDLIEMTGTRIPALDDYKERQLLNVAEEMALAAGLPTPRVVIADSTVVNAMVAGASDEAATVLVTRALLDHLNRDQVQAVIAHCIGSISNGDLRIMLSLMASLQTLALIQTILDLPLRRSAWRALGGYLRAMLAPQISPTKLRDATDRIEQSFDAEATEPSNPLAWPLLPLQILSLLQRIVLTIWCSLLLNWPLALLWRARRYLADGTAVQLTHNPDALAAALSQFATLAGVPAGGEERDYLFMCGSGKSKVFDRCGFRLSMHPPLDRRLKRLQAMGATRADEEPNRPSSLRRVVSIALFGIIVSPLLLIMVLALQTVIVWSMILAVFFSLALGLGFLAWAFG
jgi:Zn-dependent protease with chaperone function